MQRTKTMLSMLVTLVILGVMIFAIPNIAYSDAPAGQGDITIIKVAEGSTEDFYFSVSGADPETFELKNGESQRIPGNSNDWLYEGNSHTVRENLALLPADWYLADITCEGYGDENKITTDVSAGTVAIIIESGKEVICTFTNKLRQPETGTIIIKKETEPAGGTGFTFNGGDLGNFSLDDDGSKTFEGLTPKEYKVYEEDLPEGWDLSKIACESTGNSEITIPEDFSFLTIKLVADDTVTCTFTNKQSQPETGTIIIEKQTIPDGSPDEFTFNADGTYPLSDGEQFSLYLVGGGIAPIQEVVPEGWELTAITCVDPTQNSTIDIEQATATVNVTAGETVTCVFTNTKVIQSEIEILKYQRLSEEDPWTMEKLVVDVGDTIFYQLTVQNLSPTISELTIFDDLDESKMTYVDGSLLGSPGGSGSYDGNLLSYTWKFGDSIPTELILSFAVTVNDLVQPGDLIENWGWVVLDGGQKPSNIVQVEVVPEPTTLFFFGTGIFGLFMVMRRRRKTKK